MKFTAIPPEIRTRGSCCHSRFPGTRFPEVPIPIAIAIPIQIPIL